MSAERTPEGHVLVTGGVGFIGYHVSQALLKRGQKVVVLDDFSDAPYPAHMKERNARDLQASFPEVTIVRGCVTDRAQVSALVQGASGVVHLAGVAGVRPSFDDPARYARVNTEGTANVLMAMKELGLCRIAFASSSSVYGNSTPLPAREEEPCVVPESPYAASKRAAELIASALAPSIPGLRCSALRFFTVYGPRQRPEMAITLFATKALRGEEIVVFGDGSMRRDFTHVNDITRGVLAAYDGARPGVRAYNLGSGNPILLGDLLPAIEAATGCSLKVRHVERPLGDVDATYASIERARAELGWAPEVSFQDGLASVVDWLRAQQP